MASFIKITLDTLAPSITDISINSGASYTTSRDVSLAINTAETTTGYQMKIWGDVDGATTEAGASWETFAATKALTLTTGDGIKTVRVKVRDDVHNATTELTDTITLDTAVPTVSITGPDVSRISKVSPKNVAAFSFTSNLDFVEYKVKVVPTISSIHSAGTQIGMTSGSTNMNGTGTFPKATAINCTLNGADLETASSGDGEKIVKVFVKVASGTWSVA